MSKSVSVQCPCGQSFEREAKRGRPAVWCEACRQVPVAQRTARPVDEDGETSSSRVSRFGSHDTLTFDQREAVEAGIVEADARLSSFTSDDVWALFPDADERDIPFLIADWQRQQYVEVYDANR